jgi:predicted transcriptional regulator
MSPSPHSVLVAVVDRYEEAGEPVTAAAVAESRNVSEEALSEPLESLCEFELLEPTERGYRPTVTARELLALDVELDDALVLDLVEE